MQKEQSRAPSGRTPMTDSDLAVWISGGSLLVSAFALWRSGRVRVLDLRTKIRKDAVELRVSLNDLLKAIIPLAVQSRTNVSSAAGRTGALDIFRTEAEADTATLNGLLAELKNIEPIGLLASYSDIEAKAVSVHEIGTRVKQLHEKYLAAADADEKIREHLRNAAIARVSRN